MITYRQISLAFVLAFSTGMSSADSGYTQHQENATIAGTRVETDKRKKTTSIMVAANNNPAGKGGPGHDWIDVVSLDGGNTSKKGATKSGQTKKGRSELYLQAVKTQSKRYPQVNNVKNTGKVDPRLINIMNKGERLRQEVLQTKGSMSSQQERKLDNKMHSLIASMDRLTPNTLAGNNQAEGPASCMLECGEAYPGVGGGNGWNRFWCKSACIKISVGRAGVGGD